MACKLFSVLVSASISIITLPSPTMSSSSTFKRSHFTRSFLRMMPEGPEVKSLSDALNHELSTLRQPYLVGANIISGKYLEDRPKGWDVLAQAFVAPEQGSNCLSSEQGLRLHSIGCKGKFLFMTFPDSQISIWSTLGLSGGWSFSKSCSRHIRLSLHFNDRSTTASKIIPMYFYDMRNFGNFRISSDPKELIDKLDSLGYDWLASPEEFLAKHDEFSRGSFSNTLLGVEQFIALGQSAAKRKRPLCVFLMDQSKTCGIGNYILSEALYSAKIHPFACSSSLTVTSWESLYKSIQNVITQSYFTQTKWPSVDPDTNSSFEFQVYAQQRTRDSGRLVKKETGTHKRTIHWDPITQILHAPLSRAKS